MMSFATLTWFTLLLIVQQALSRPADSTDNESVTQTGHHIISEYPGDVPEDLTTTGMGQPGASVISQNTAAETEESKPVSQSFPATGQASPEDTTTDQNNPTVTLASSVTSPSSLEHPGTYETRGFLDNLFGSSVGSQTPNKVGAESQKPNKLEAKAGQQSATLISATTYPEGSKPSTSSKPASGQEKPTSTTGQEKPTAALTPSAKPPSYQSKPPGSSLNGAILSSLFGFPVAAGSKKPNKPPTFPGSGFSQLGSSPFGSSSFGSSPGSSPTFPGSMAGCMQHMPPPPPPMMFGSPFGGSGSPFGSGKNGNSFAIPQWLASLMRSIETSPDELSTANTNYIT